MPAARKRPKKGLEIPIAAKESDTGLIVNQLLNGPKYLIWYKLDGKRKRVSLPAGLTLEEARRRRDQLYYNLQTKYQARRRKAKESSVPQAQRRTNLTPDTYIYRRRDPWVIRILGKQIGTARTKHEAREKRDTWLRANPDKVPGLAGIPAENSNEEES